jgi:hypothetical protein
MHWKVWMKSPCLSKYGAKDWIDGCTVAGSISSREVS